MTAATLVGLSAPASAAPTNDDIAGARVISSLPFTDAVNTSEATVAAEYECGAATVWYSFTPSDSGAYVFSTRDSNYDTMLAVYSDPPSAETRLTCVDDTNVSTRASVRIELTGGLTYYIQASTCCGAETIGQIGPGGDLVLTAEVAPPALDLDAAVTGASVNHRTGVAFITGTVRCNNDSQIYLDGLLRQRVAGTSASVTAYFYSATSCVGGSGSWRVTVAPSNGAFSLGSARLEMTVYGSDAHTSDQVSLAQNVRLRATRQ